jgi:hypothetical protein
MLRQYMATYNLTAGSAPEEEGRLGVLDGLGRPLHESPLGASIPGFSGRVEVRI